MNCDRALMALLDAELPELTAGSTTLAVHVRGCARCGRVANRLMTDTYLLVAAMPASVAQRHRSIHRVAMPALAVAASLLVAVAIQLRGKPPVTSVTAELPPIVVEPAAPAAPAARVAAVARDAPGIPIGASPAPRTEAREFPRALPVVAVRLDGSASVIASSAVAIPAGRVSVTPPAGTRAVVMQTGDPKLVVVWLY